MAKKELNIYQRITKVTEAIGAFEKNGEHPHYMFAGIESVVATLQPLCIEHGICLIQEAIDGGMVDNAGKLLSVCTIVTTAVNVDSPEDRHVTRTTAQGWDSTDKGIYKANSGGRKYAIFGMFNIHAGEDDPEYSGKPSDAPRRSEPSRTPKPSGGTADGHPTAKQVDLIYDLGKRLYESKGQFLAYVEKWFSHTALPEELTYAEGKALLENLLEKSDKKGRG